MYAIKELNLQILRQKIDNLDSIIKTEIDLLSKMNHRNIVKYYGYCKNNNSLIIVLEYCSKGSLLNLLQIFKHFEENMIKKYISEILDGLEYLHLHNIIHRDIKCANILLDKDGICKLTDFGTAKIMKEEMNIQSSMQGTPNWMAPEIWKTSTSTRYSDIWSIGCTVIEMFQGEPPYNDKKDLSSFLKIMLNKELPKIPDKMSDQLKDFVKKCLVYEPNKRFNVYQLKRHPFLKDYYNNSINNTNNSTLNSFG